ncbi:MFS transporter [Streptomyces sp. TG1A-8]|uniref:MFS transporter n=1 Tax=Streptomyces sp. TG1A-8 TaxID=3051385 RepID=UPI00265BDE66|nr:MFS transporter [Streptomyces sp. TG1A-8]MDO0924864.1 MFS transporter [Streptomyces sp. TG1A-8]
MDTRNRRGTGFAAPRRDKTLPAAALILIAGTLFSRVGDSLASLGLVLDAADRHVGWGVTEVFLAELVPTVVAAPVIGTVVDRLSGRKVCLGALVAQALCLGTATAVPGFHLRVALIALSGLAGVASVAAGFKMLPVVAGEEHTGRANSLLTAGLSAAGLVGPPLAGFLHSARGTSLLLGADAASFLVLAWCTARAVPRSTDVAIGRKPASRLSDGYRALRHAPVVGPLLPALAAAMLATSIEGVAGVFYLRHVASGNDTVFGLFLATWALGSVPGALLAGRASWSGRHTALILGGVLGISLGLLLVGLIPVAAAVFPLFLLGGFGNGACNVGLRNAVHTQVPAEVHGSAWACFQALSRSCVGLGYLLGTPNDLVSSQDQVIVSGAIPLAAVAWAVLAGLRRRQPALTEASG